MIHSASGLSRCRGISAREYRQKQNHAMHSLARPTTVYGLLLTSMRLCSVPASRQSPRVHGGHRMRPYTAPATLPEYPMPAWELTTALTDFGSCQSKRNRATSPVKVSSEVGSKIPVTPAGRRITIIPPPMLWLRRGKASPTTVRVYRQVIAGARNRYAVKFWILLTRPFQWSCLRC
jgi:hypothetical protein